MVIIILCVIGILLVGAVQLGINVGYSLCTKDIRMWLSDKYLYDTEIPIKDIQDYLDKEI